MAQGKRLSPVLQFPNSCLHDILHSCATPVIASIISQLNGARLSLGLRPLGFLNPFLYSVGYKALTDIVDGGSKGCRNASIKTNLPAPLVPFASWNATKGWDPVTGLGTPDFPKLLRLVRRYGVGPWVKHGYAPASSYSYGGE